MVAQKTHSVWTLAILVLFLVSAFPVTTAGPSPLGDDDDAGSGTDAGDWLEDALSITSGEYAGRLSAVIDYDDWYAFEVTPGQGIAVDVDRELLSYVYFDLYNEEQGYHYLDSYDTTRVLTSTNTTSTTWYLGASAYLFPPSGSGAYSFEITLVDLPAQNDAGSGRDASRDEPVALPDGESTGTMNAFDTREIYVLDVVGTQTIRVNFTSTFPDHTYLNLGTTTCCDNSYDYDSGTNSLSVEVTATDTQLKLHLGIYNWYNDEIIGGNYTLDVTRLSANPVDLPDLVITKIVEHRSPIKTDFTDDVPNNVNEHRIIEVDITNKGSADAASFEAGLSAYRGHSADYEPWGAWDYNHWAWVDNGLAAGETITVTFVWETTLAVGDYTLVAGADTWQQVTEDDEENNVDRIFTYSRVGGLI